MVARRRASTQVTGAALLLVGLLIGEGLVFATSYVYGGFSPKTLTATSIDSITMTFTTIETQSVTQTETITSTVTASNMTTTGTGADSIAATATLVVPSGTSPGTIVFFCRE